jgi:putative phosphotransacetylase
MTKIEMLPKAAGAAESLLEGRRVSDMSSGMRVPVVIGARHAYLTTQIIEELFCDKYRLHVQAEVSQPAQYACEEHVSLIGPQGRLDHVRVIGPPRGVNQIELSLADARTLGIEAPLRESGDLADTPGILIEGPRTCARVEHCVIRPLRHVHMPREDAEKYAVHDHDRVDLRDAGDPQRVILRDVLVRVAPEYRLELHLDESDGIAAGLHTGDFVSLAPSQPAP